MDTNTNNTPPKYTTPPVYGFSPREQVKKCYNRACMTMLFQFLIVNVISFIAMFVYGIVVSAQAMANGASAEEAMKLVTNVNPMFVILINAICFLIANPLAYFIGNTMTKNHYHAKAFGEIKLPITDCVLPIFSILGLQGFSLLVQYGLIMLTKTSAIDESTAAMFSFSDNITQNVIMVVYFVFIAAITEELLCRGLVLKLLSPVNKTFAVVASALIFGIMHGNFGQIFNGFLLGLVLGYVAVKSKSLWLPIICHMAANTNAMVISYFEYRYGESLFIAEIIYAVVLTVIAAAAIFLLIRRNGKIDEENDGFPVVQAIDVPEEEKSKCKWKALLSTPCFWIFFAIYFINAILMLTPIM